MKITAEDLESVETAREAFKRLEPDFIERLRRDYPDDSDFAGVFTGAFEYWMLELARKAVTA